MANRNSPMGLVARYHRAGGCIRTEKVTLSAANSIIGRGDPLVMVNDGLYDLWSSGRIDAVAAEPSAASSGASIQAYRDPMIVYSCQTDDGTGTGTVQTAINLNATLVAAAPSNGVSRFEIDETSVDTTATLPAPNNALGEFNELFVSLNNTGEMAGTGTLGI